MEKTRLYPLLVNEMKRLGHEKVLYIPDHFVPGVGEVPAIMVNDSALGIVLGFVAAKQNGVTLEMLPLTSREPGLSTVFY